MLVPYLEGERTPNLPDATGSLHGLTLATATRPALARASVEGLVCSLADGLDAVVATGVTPSRVLLVGGAAASEAVRTVAAEVLGVPGRRPAAGGVRRRRRRTPGGLGAVGRGRAAGVGPRGDPTLRLGPRAERARALRRGSFAAPGQDQLNFLRADP